MTAAELQAMWDRVLAARGPAYEGPRARLLGDDDGTGLSGFQRGVTSRDGALPVPEHETEKAPVVVAPPPVAAPAPRPDPMKMGYAEFAATQNQKPPAGALLGKPSSAPIEMETKKNIIAYDDNGPVYGPDIVRPKSTLFQVPSTNNLAEQKRINAAKEPPAAAAAAPDPATLGNKYGKEGSASGAAGAEERAPITWGNASGTATIAAHEQAVVSGARQAELGKAVDAQGKAIEGQKDAAVGSADAAAEVERQKAVGTQGIGKQFEDSAVDAKVRAQEAADESKAYRAQIADFAKKLSTDKVDHNKMWNDSSTGQKIAWTMAKAFGAIGQAFLHTPTNQVADSIDAMVAGDVADQRANHEVGREHLADMKTAYAQALQATGDREAAERVAVGYGLEAAKQNAIALTENATSAAQKARGRELTAALDERIAVLGEKKVKEGIAMNPYVQARTVSTGPDMKEVYKTARQFTEEQAKHGTVVKPDDAIRWAFKMHTGRDPLSGAFVQGSKAEPGSKTEKLEEARTEVKGGISTIDRALESGAAYKQGPLGSLWAKVPGATDSKMDELQRNKYNAQAKALVGAAWKLTTSGMEPKNPAIIEELSEHYQIHPSDSEELARAKMKELQNLLRDAGTSKGVVFDETRKDIAGIPEAYKTGEAKKPAAAPSSLKPVAK